ncbi:ice-binding family protein, partial [Nocardioides sp.]
MLRTLRTLRTWRAGSARGGVIAMGAVVAVTAVPLTAILLTLGGNPSAAAATAVNLGTAQSFAVLGGQAVTNTGPTVAWGDLGVSPKPDVSGFPPGTVLGTIHRADEVAQQAQSDLTTAYGVLAGQPSDQAISADLAGRRLTTGVYTSSSSMGLSGELTLDAQGDPSAVFVFQVGSALTTGPGSAVTLANGAQACNVFWQVSSSATLGTNSTLRGTVVALTSITATTGATIEGRLLARNGAVTLDDNRIIRPGCATGPTTTGSGSGGPTTRDVGTDGPGGPTTGSGSG